MVSSRGYYRGLVALVTGAASGIGLALAERLSTLGADVTLVDVQLSLAEQAADRLRSAGGTARAAALDVTDFEATEALYGSVARNAGRLDLVFNNAGIWMMGDVEAFAISDWNRLIDVNLRGTVHGTKAAYEIMLKQGFGHIVNTASVAGLTPDPGCTAYAATKHAVVGLCKSMRAEAALHGIKVTALCPGVVQTPLLAGGGKYGKVLHAVEDEQMQAMWKRMRPMPADAFAERALRDIARNKPIIVHPFAGRLAWLLDRLSPSLSIRVSKNLHVSNQRLMGVS